MNENYFQLFGLPVGFAVDAEALALSRDKVVAQLAGAAPRRVIARPPKLVNIVV